jgi:glutathione S-transferase
MEPVYIVILLSLLEYLVLTGLVGRARGVYGVKAPAVTGHPAFERTFRVQQNTLESLIVFVPAVWIFGLYVSVVWATVLGTVFLVARAIYAVGYIRAAEKRGLGAGISGLVVAALVVGGLIGLGLKLI